MKITQIVPTAHAPYAVYARKNETGAAWVPVAIPVLCWALESDMMYDERSATYYPGFKVTGMIHPRPRAELLIPAFQHEGFLGYAESKEGYEAAHHIWRKEAQEYGKEVSESS